MKFSRRRDVGPLRWHDPAGQRPDLDPLRISGLGDAMATALGIAKRFKRAHASVALDENGLVIDLTCFTAAHHSIETALVWADCLSYNDPRFRLLLLISAGKEDVSTLAEEDVDVFRSAQRVWADRTIPLIDWLKSNRDGVRSMAISLGSQGGYELIQT